MARPVRLLIAMLIALGTIGFSTAHPTYASGGNVADCLFTTLQTDLQAGGDWYYTAGQCTAPIVFTKTIYITSNASLTAQGHDVTLDGGHSSTVTGVVLFIEGTSGTSPMTFGLTGLTLSHGWGTPGAIWLNGSTNTLNIASSTLSGNAAGDGGAILSSGTLSITNSTLSNNYASSYGGAIVSAGGTLTITGSTLSGNYAKNGTGGAISGGPMTITNSTLSGNTATGGDGGAIRYQGTSTITGMMTITGSTLSGNSSTGSGGAIENAAGTVAVTNSTLSGNTATGGNGGAIWNGATAAITNSTLSGNTASSNGGAIGNYFRLTMTSSTLSGNSASSGGAISGGNQTITNSTLSGNSASSDGGAIFNTAASTVTNSTLSGNAALSGGAMYNNSGGLTIGGSIIVSSTGGNCAKTFTDIGYNLEWSGAGHANTCGFGASGKHDITGSDPQLGSLADNGGPTQTMALQAGVPPIDQIPTTYDIPPTTTPLCPATDQRGIARPDNGESSCDIGAYEFDGTDSTPTNTSSVSSTQQYTLTGSDGSTWTTIDGTNLSATLNPAANCTAILSGNVDLWTSSAGYNQDIGIWVAGGAYGSGQVVAWKESGGFAGTFSPNAAYVQTVLSLASGTTYTTKLVWKSNKADPGTIWAGAGPIGGAYSPTRLTAEFIPATSSTTVSSAASTQQYTLTGSDGSTWTTMDGTNLSQTLIPSSSGTALLSGNSDLWTSSAGYNQDLGIWVSGGSYGSGQVVAWKESGGFAGTYSPNAAFVQTVVSLSGGTTYAVKLVWKSNKSDPGTIWAGAGPIGGAFSPTRLTVELIPTSSTTTVSSAVSTQQYTLQNSDGSTWTPMDGTTLSTSFTPASTSTAILSGNSDLWTSSAGYNQDIGIWVSGGAYGSGQVVAWKESGGFAGTFSPNAAYVHTVLPLASGTAYTMKLVWKSNRADPGTIWAGAGPIGGAYSPTRLTAELVPATSG